MNRLKLALKLSCAAALAWPLLNACGGEDRPDALPGGTGATGGTGDGGRRPPRDAGDGSTDSGSDSRADARDAFPDSGVNLPGAPVVTITSPKALATPTADVLTGGEVTVLCSARKASGAGASDVDESSVVIEMLDSAGTPLQESSGTPTDIADEYRARFPLAGVSSGRVSFRCSAITLSTSPLLGTQSIETFVDHGPNITPIIPQAGSARAVKTPVRFEFSVEPARLAPTDAAADVESVKFSVDGKDVPAVAIAGQPGKYGFSVDFNELFSPPPTGSVAVVITAKNKRTSAGTVRTHTYSFALDASGPAINVLAPTERAVVGGEIELRFSVIDEHAGTNNSKLVVDVAGTESTYTPNDARWSHANGTFTYKFDSTSITNTTAQITINITAVDNVENESLDSHVLYLDNQPPIVDLDPPTIREAVDQGTSYRCSHPFDPLGTAASDLDRVYPATLFRALVWERTNAALGQRIVFYSGVNEDSVQLFLQPDVNQALVVDTNGDGVCDDIPEDLRRDLQSHRLRPLRPEGSPVFGPDNTLPPVPTALCKTEGPLTTPEGLCLGRSDLTRVIDHTMSGSQAVVYADTPGDGLTCTGIDWEILPRVNREGWVCFAARATDRVGNVGVSRPLRVCLDDGVGSNGVPTCTNPPPCAAACTPPPRFSIGHPTLGAGILERTQ